MLKRYTRAAVKYLFPGVLAAGLFVLVGFSARVEPSTASAASLAPASIVTVYGSTDGGAVGNLDVMDQSGSDDDPARYVGFIAPATIYRGYRQYFLPPSVKRSWVTSLSVSVNYKGPASAGALWSWYLFSWGTNSWVRIGTNASALDQVWSPLSFGATSPARFIRSTGEIRLLLLSAHAGSEAKLDFEGLRIGYNLPPTPTPTATPANMIALAIDASQARRPISPYIYGLNFAKPAFAQEIALPVRRWGGNDTSRYNWQSGNSNSGSDWFYENMPYSDPYTGADMTASDWIHQNVATGADSLLTIPMLGFVAKDPTSCGFNTALYGAQQHVDPYRTSCGNGLTTGGQPITGNRPADTSLAADANFMGSWVQNLVTTFGPAASGGVKFYALDNEPELWSETHRDVHPAAQTYDELLAKSLAYGAAVKSADPSAQLFGYVSYGWTGYWYSEYDALAAAANGYTYFPDYATHGNQYQIPWYLTQMKAYEQSSGTRLLDYLDLHFYPDNGVSLTTAGTAAMQALRLRSTRSLWDPTYVDESWIGGSDQPADWREVQLIPRMHAWVDSYYPGTKLSLSEYNWGGLESINGALTQADLLGIFGRQGLDMALLWNYPDSGSTLGYDHFETLPGAYAFRLYRNYDGNGSQFGDTSVSAASGSQSRLAVYAAQRSSDSALTIVVINKTAGALTGHITLSGFSPSGSAHLYRYSSANLKAIVHLPDQTLAPGGWNASFPANSITLIVVPAG